MEHIEPTARRRDFRMTMRSFLAAPLLALCLAGCVSFLPPYDEAVHQQLAKAVEDINKIGAATRLEYREPSFEEVEPYYISAFSYLYAAEDTASGRSRDFRGTIPGQSAELMTQAIGNCRQSLLLLLELHRSEGIDGTDFTDSNVSRTCSIASMMAARLKR